MSADNTKQKVVELKAPDEAPAKPAATAAATPEPAPAPRRSRRRYIIMAAVPVVLLAIGGWLWLTGGRYASTDNAYIQQDRVTITADVSGRIVEVGVTENQMVHKGDLLFRIDPEPYQIALRQAEAAVAAARLQVEEMRAAYQQAVSQLKTARDSLTYEQAIFKRQQDLLKKGVSSQATYDSAENDLRAAEQDVSAAEQKVAGAEAALGGDPEIATDKHPTVMQALAALDQARLNLDKTSVHAPADGVVAQADRLQVGLYVPNPTGNPTALLSLVETGDTWVEANFKETDLTRMVPGEPATITIDAYPGHTFTGEVASIGAGTGSEFSLLPAQNATGNWVKVVQRVPVRIRFTEPTDGLPLRTGLSASVEVDLMSGGNAAAAATPAK